MASFPINLGSYNGDSVYLNNVNIKADIDCNAYENYYSMNDLVISYSAKIVGGGGSGGVPRGGDNAGAMVILADTD